ncbi:hypothetical protein A9K71_23220 [Mesorhizobium sp. WSM3873]|nr:hypothetical protein A9K71_23220 [Mesorhizobium sp. WSM3873]
MIALPNPSKARVEGGLFDGAGSWSRVERVIAPVEVSESGGGQGCWILQEHWRLRIKPNLTFGLALADASKRTIAAGLQIRDMPCARSW